MRRWLHRNFWQRLPRGWRQKIFFALTTALAPRPGFRPPVAAQPVYVVGSLRTASGLGEAARQGLEALLQAGWDIQGVDLSNALMQNAKLIDYEFPEAEIMEGAGTIILYVSPALTAFAMWRLGRHRVWGKTIIGYWAWELPDLPSEWWSACQFVHEIWAPSRFSATAFRHHTVVPVRVLPYAVPPSRAEISVDRRERLQLTVLIVFDMASGFRRKNPLAAIQAFRLAFGDDPDWCLIVKTMDVDQDHSAYKILEDAISDVSNISIDKRLLSTTQICTLIASCDVVLSLHRSEGFGFVLAEAMRCGKVVVATDWSGNTDFLNHENGCPVRYHLVPAIDPQGRYHHPEQVWAEPDIGDAVRQLTRLRDVGLLRRLGERAQQDADLMFSAATHNASVASYLGLSENDSEPGQDEPPNI